MSSVNPKIAKGIVAAIFAVIIVIIGASYSSIHKTTSPGNINPDSILPPSETTGFIPEKIIGNPDEAELVLYEYVDFSCIHCAEWNREINKQIAEYDGKIALVFRSFNLGSKNGALAAQAATSAQILGYFKEYPDLRFATPPEWLHEEESDLLNLLVKYFGQASNGTGDTEKFKEDKKRDSVKARLEFEQKLGKKINLTGTPTFRINNKTIELDELVETIKTRLNN
ncbi:thioredoxin domain-containing protein [Candidatus Saccharibacteria bacterium]|nr:thioredoxin domain-containing protein [Candidatus Saccharibacteria bacterium]